MPRRYYTYPERFSALNVASTAGSSLLAFGFIIILVYLVYALRRRARGTQPLGVARLRVADHPAVTAAHQGQLRDTPLFDPATRDYQETGEEVEHASSSTAATPAPRAAAHPAAHHFDTREADARRPPGHVAVPGTEVLLFAGLFVATRSTGPLPRGVHHARARLDSRSAPSTRWC